jgi:hypothetical protein
VAVACGSGGAAAQVSPTSNPSTATHLPGLPSRTLPGYVIHVMQLDPATLSTDALDPPSLEAVLTGAGFEAGTEKRFTARGKRVTEVVARVVRFKSAEGARMYLEWLGAHGADLLGSRTRTTDPPDLPTAIAFSHGLSGCCTKDTFQYFAAWARGPYVLTLRVGGPGAGLRSAAPLAEALDAQAWKSLRGSSLAPDVGMVGAPLHDPKLG